MFVGKNQWISFYKPFFFPHLFFFFSIFIGNLKWNECMYIWSDCGCNFADIVAYPRCAFNELQKQDKMEDTAFTQR